MTTVDLAAGAGAADLRRASRILTAVILPLGPAVVAVLRFVLPYETSDSSTEIVRKVSAAQSTQSAVVWLGLIAGLTMVPAAIWASRAVSRQSPRLATAAVLLMVPGYISLSWLVAGDAALLFGVRHHVAPTTLASMYDNVHPAGIVAGVIFVLGHVLGTVLLAIALIRTRVVPLWAGIATLISQPVHFVAAVIVGSHALDLVGWGLNAVGFAAIALAVLRTSDDEWALPPASS